MTITPARISTAECAVLDTIRSAGFVESAGWFYFADPERSLVRITVFGGQYQLWRRRRIGDGWMIICTADVEEFDPRTFATWCSGWPLIA